VKRSRKKVAEVPVAEVAAPEPVKRSRKKAPTAKPATTPVTKAPAKRARKQAKG
jgi:hypothetical protein